MLNVCRKQALARTCTMRECSVHNVQLHVHNMVCARYMCFIVHTMMLSSLHLSWWQVLCTSLVDSNYPFKHVTMNRACPILLIPTTNAVCFFHGDSVSLFYFLTKKSFTFWPLAIIDCAASVGRNTVGKNGMGVAWRWLGSYQVYIVGIDIFEFWMGRGKEVHTIQTHCTNGCKES